MYRKLTFLFLLGIQLLWASSSFDWSLVLEIPPGSDQISGNQILHFKSKNKPFWDSQQATEIVNHFFVDAVQLYSDADVLRYASDHVTLNGLFIELGVCTGKTINYIAALNSHQTIYGFDSFEGLPEDWMRADQIIRKGTFAFKDPEILPPVLHNVTLIKGLFAYALNDFIQKIEPLEPIAFIHVDCDIYSSTMTALDILKERIVPGTVIVFDEFYNYPGYENHEYKAFQEFLAERNLSARCLAYNAYHEQAAFCICTDQ
jgi:hypothetical protein